MQTDRSLPVHVNVYDIHASNAYLSPIGAGFYHTGVEIDGWEYSFSSSGVNRTRPRLESFGQIKEHMLMGAYHGSMNELRKHISELSKDRFRPGSYQITSLNCNHFSDALVFVLVGEHLPAWINRMANLGSYVLPATAAKASDSMPAPGPVASPIVTTKQPAEAAEEPGLLASIFGFFGSSKSAPAAGAVPVAAQPPAGATTGIVGGQKKELTDKQKEIIARMKASKG